MFLLSSSSAAPYLAEQTLDASLLTQRNPAPPPSSSQTPGSSTPSSAPSSQPAHASSTPPSSSGLPPVPQGLVGMPSSKPSGYTAFVAAGLQAGAPQNGPQAAGAPGDNGSTASQPQPAAEPPER